MYGPETQEEIDAWAAERGGPFHVLRWRWFRWRVLRITTSDHHSWRADYSVVAGPYWRKKTGLVALTVQQSLNGGR